MHVHVSKHAVIFESTISPHRAHQNSARQFLRTHMCQTCLLLDSKASGMLVDTHADVSDHPAIFKGTNSLHCINTLTHDTHGLGLNMHVDFLHVRLSGCL